MAEQSCLCALFVAAAVGVSVVSGVRIRERGGVGSAIVYCSVATSTKYRNALRMTNALVWRLAIAFSFRGLDRQGNCETRNTLDT